MVGAVLIGVDIGTSSTKAAVVTEDGDVLAIAAREYPVSTPQPGWAEQDPQDWVGAVHATVAQAVSRAGVAPSAVTGLSFSGQMHGLVCLDAAHRPLRPAIIWADQRSASEVAAVEAEVGEAQLAAWTGNPLASGFMLASWLWLLAHEAGIAAATHQLLLPKDYVRYRLTGEMGAEPSDASSTSLFDPRRRCWSLPLLRELGLDAGLLPPVHASTEIAGMLQPDAAAVMGLLPGLPVVYGGSDQAAQALGNGIVAPGLLSSTIGTGGQLLAPTTEPVVDEKLRMHCFCHVVDGLWHTEAAILSAGLSLRWLRDQILTGSDYRSLADSASTAPVGSDGLLYLPYLSGERSPHMDPLASGSLIGLTRRHGPSLIARAVMEGVVYAMRQGLDLMDSLGAEVREVVASGGGTRHPLWLQLQADIYQRPVRRTATSEAAAIGAAMLAGIGTGVYSGAVEAIARVVRWEDGVTEPDPARVARYAEGYAAYCGLYPALRATMHGLRSTVGVS